MSNTAAVIVTLVATVVLVLVPVLMWRFARRIQIHPYVMLTLVAISLMPRSAYRNPAKLLDEVNDMWRKAFEAAAQNERDDDD